MNIAKNGSKSLVDLGVIAKEPFCFQLTYDTHREWAINLTDSLSIFNASFLSQFLLELYFYFVPDTSRIVYFWSMEDYIRAGQEFFRI